MIESKGRTERISALHCRWWERFENKKGPGIGIRRDAS
jgi:hypothetical protein